MFADSPGFAGLFLATLYGGALSSVSSSLSGCAANCWEDILQWKLKHWPESRKALLNRFLVVLFGLAATGQAFVASAVPGPISQIGATISSAIVGPLCGLFLLGGLNRHANWKGALVGGFTSIIGSSWLISGAYTMKRRHLTFPPLGIDGCIASNNLTFPEYGDTNSSSIFHFFDESPVNTTMTYFRPQSNQTIEVDYQGLEKFYSLSYIWYSLLWVTVTVLVGSIASFLLKDRSTEEKVDESLLINFRQIFRCREDTISDSASQKYSDINYKAVEIRTEENDKKEHQVDLSPLAITRRTSNSL